MLAMCLSDGLLAVSAGGKFEEYLEALLERGPPYSRDERQRVYSLHDAAVREHELQPPYQSTGITSIWRGRAPLSRELLEVKLGPVEEDEPPAPREPGERLSDKFPEDLYTQLEERLKERAEYKQNEEPIPERLSHDAIALALRPIADDPDFKRTRVQRAEKARELAMEARGWDLARLISRREFDAGNGYRYFPAEAITRRALGLPPKSKPVLKSSR